jgi:hypothetical protein
MKKPLALLFLSFTIACFAWAEKYEYVRLKTGESFELGSGDTARLIAASTNSTGSYSLNDGEESFEFYVQSSGNPLNPHIMVGPGVVSSENQKYLVFAIQRASDTGSTTLAWNGTEWEGSSDGSQQASNGVNPTSIKYDELLGWAYFTDTNWVYSYTNLSWYYMHPTSEGFYVWNANLPENGWTKLERG